MGPIKISNQVKFLHSNWLWLAAIALIWIFQIFLIDYVEVYALSIALYTGINIILAVSLNLVNGFTGQFSMGHAGFMSIGAYTSAFLSLYVGQLYPQFYLNPAFGGLVFVGVIAAGGLMSAIFGYLVGLPSLRLKGDYLAIVTLGFGEIIRVLFLNIDAVGGARGLPGIPPLTNFAWIYTFVVITTLVIYRLIRTPSGRSFLAVREDEIAAEAMGVNITAAKVRAFVIGAFFAGVAGALFAHQIQAINPQGFDFNKSFESIIMVVLGGMGSITGSVVAATVLTSLKEGLRYLQEFTKVDLRMIIYALLLILLMLLRPNGIFGTKEIGDLFRRKRGGE